MREATLQEFQQAIRHINLSMGGEIRRMFTKRRNDYFYSQVGIPVAERHVTLIRGKVSGVSYLVNDAFLADGSTEDICKKILLG